MRDSDLQEIRVLPLFRDMGNQHFAELMRGAYHQSFPPQVTLIQEGSKADFLHVVTNGAVELFASWNARETTMAVARPVSTFILAACINDSRYLMSGRTLVASRIALIPGSNLREIFGRDTAFARAIVQELATGYRSVVRHTKNIKLRASKERLAAFLLHEANAGGFRPVFGLPYGKRLIASYLGMTPENLSRALRQLRDDGVTVEGSVVTIHDLERLQAVALPAALMDDQA